MSPIHSSKHLQMLVEVFDSEPADPSVTVNMWTMHNAALVQLSLRNFSRRDELQVFFRALGVSSGDGLPLFLISQAMAKGD